MRFGLTWRFTSPHMAACAITFNASEPERSWRGQVPSSRTNGLVLLHTSPPDTGVFPIETNSSRRFETEGTSTAEQSDSDQGGSSTEWEVSFLGTDVEVGYPIIADDGQYTDLAFVEGQFIDEEFVSEAGGESSDLRVEPPVSKAEGDQTTDRQPLQGIPKSPFGNRAYMFTKVTPENVVGTNFCTVKLTGKGRQDTRVKVILYQATEQASTSYRITELHSKRPGIIRKPSVDDRNRFRDAIRMTGCIAGNWSIDCDAKLAPPIPADIILLAQIDIGNQRLWLKILPE